MGISVLEFEIFGGLLFVVFKKKCWYFGMGLCWKLDDVCDDCGNLKYFEEVDEVVYKGICDEIVFNFKIFVKVNVFIFLVE